MRKYLILSSLIFCACSTKYITTDKNLPNGNIAVNGKLFTTLFQQQAAEYRALCFQAYNVARLRIDQYKAAGDKPLALITDIDETVLDNSPYEAHRTLQGNDYEQESWYPLDRSFICRHVSRAQLHSSNMQLQRE